MRFLILLSLLLAVPSARAQVFDDPFCAHFAESNDKVSRTAAEWRNDPDPWKQGKAGEFLAKMTKAGPDFVEKCIHPRACFQFRREMPESEIYVGSGSYSEAWRKILELCR